MKHRNSLWSNTRGDAVVEATILFPIIIMIFAGLVLLAMYLPTRSALQRATQVAATAIATERSDTWLYYDVGAMDYKWESDPDALPNVYSALIRAIGGSGRDDADNVEQIITTMEANSILNTPGDLTVKFGVVNYIVYKEIVVTATRTIPIPVNLSFVGFPTEIPVTVTSTAVVQNGEEFVRNMDLAVDVTNFVAEGLGVSDVFQKVGEVCGEFANFLGI